MIVQLGKNGKVCQMGEGEAFRPERVFQGDMTLGSPVAAAEKFRFDRRQSEKAAMAAADNRAEIAAANKKAASDKKKIAEEIKRIRQEAEEARTGHDPMLHLALSQTLGGDHMRFSQGLSGNPLTADGSYRKDLTMGFSFADALTSAQNLVSTVADVKSLITGPTQEDIAKAQAAAYAQQQAAALAQAQAAAAQTGTIQAQTALAKAQAALSSINFKSPVVIAAIVGGLGLVGFMVMRRKRAA